MSVPRRSHEEADGHTDGGTGRGEGRCREGTHRQGGVPHGHTGRRGGGGGPQCRFRAGLTRRPTGTQTVEGRGKVEGNWRPRPWVRRDGEGRGTGRQRSSGRLALGQGSRSPPRMGWRLLQVAGLGVRGRGGKGAESYSRTGGRRPRRRTRPVRPGRQVYIGLACSVGQSSSRGGHLRACGFQRGRPGFRMRVSNPARAILPPGYHVHRRVCTGQLGQVRGTGRVQQRSRGQGLR